MSTKSSIKWRDETINAPGFHLYEDVLEVEEVVYLNLTGLKYATVETCSGSVSVTIAIPNETARALGLLPAKSA